MFTTIRFRQVRVQNSVVRYIISTTNETGTEDRIVRLDDYLSEMLYCSAHYTRIQAAGFVRDEFGTILETEEFAFAN